MTCETITLLDPHSGTSAKILPGVGFNCYRFQTSDALQKLDVLWWEPGFETGKKRPSGSGIPLLFPFPGRIASAELHWDDTTFPLSDGDGLGNALHGFVYDRPWRVIQADGKRAVGQFQASVDDPKILDLWPADFRITATYDISDNRLTSRFLLENPGDQALPCGFGTHPYFRLPLGGSTADDCRVQLPVASSWELVNMNATGILKPLDDPSLFQNGQNFGSMTLDNVFSDLVFTDQLCHATILDPQSGHRTTLTFDRAFRECVVYTPPHREAICIEPYTCVPDPFRLEPQGIDAGLSVLNPGESIETYVEIRVE